MSRPATAGFEESPGVGRLAIRVARELRNVADRQLEPLGVTMQQAELLIATYLRGEVPSRHYTSLLLTDEAGVSRLVDRLEAKGFVRRRPGRDRRSLSLELTASGRTLVARMKRRREIVDRQLRSGLSDAEIETARAVLTKVLDNIANMPRRVR